MAKGKFEGVVVGGKPWEIKDKETGAVTNSGYSYLVMIQGEKNAKTGLSESAEIVFASTLDKQFDKAIKEGARVVFLGEYKAGYGEQKGGMKYTDMALLK